MPTHAETYKQYGSGPDGLIRLKTERLPDGRVTGRMTCALCPMGSATTAEHYDPKIE